MRRGAAVSLYGVAWLLAGLACCALLLWLLILRPGARGTAVPLERIKLDSRKDDAKGGPDQPAPSVDDQAAAIELGLQDAELSITSGDGSISMTLWADAGSKVGGNYRIKTGALQFAQKGKDTILIRVTDASFVRERGTAKVRGTLTGYIYGSDQYFTAQELYWDKDKSVVTAHAVRYVGPSVDVSGSEMSIDLITKAVRFEGPVEAGI